jgi:pimeloyl-ACP methyl ester carboxylesterase
VGRAHIENHRLRLEDGRDIGYSGWGDPGGMPVLLGHGTPGSRRDRYYPGLDDQEWLLRRRVRFIGVDRPGYGYSDPWPEASLLDCAEDLARVADHLGLERFWALGTSGGGPYVLALGALEPERLRGIAIVSGVGPVDRLDALDGMSEGNVAEFTMAMESPRELAAALDDAARALRDDPEGAIAELLEELPEVDRRMFERPDFWAILIESLTEAVRQDATGWADDDLRLVRPWPFGLDEIGVEVHLYHGEEDVLVPPKHAMLLAEGLRGSRLHMYPAEGHLSVGRHIGEVVETLLAS